MKKALDAVPTVTPANVALESARQGSADLSTTADLRLLLRDLARQGIISWRGGKPKGCDPLVTLTPGPDISDYVISETEGSLWRSRLRDENTR